MKDQAFYRRLDQDTKSLNERVKDYYRGERISNTLLGALGMLILICVLLLYLIRGGNLSRGLVLSTVPLSIFFILSGSYRFIRSLRRYRLAQDRAFLYSKEMDHLAGRQDRFRMKRKVDQIALLSGILLVLICVFFRLNHYLLASASVISIFSAILLAFDLFGQFRTDELMHHLKKNKE